MIEETGAKKVWGVGHVHTASSRCAGFCPSEFSAPEGAGAGRTSYRTGSRLLHRLPLTPRSVP